MNLKKINFIAEDQRISGALADFNKGFEQLDARIMDPADELFLEAFYSDLAGH